MSIYSTNPEVTRPETTPLKSSILDHVKAAGHLLDNMARFGSRNNEGLWVSYNCLDLLVPTPMCPDPTIDDPDADPFVKTFGVAPWTPGFEFAVHGAVQCNPVGLDKADQESEVKRVFALSEGKGIERALRENRFVERTAPTGGAVTGRNRRDLGEWDGPVDLTEGVTVNLKTALALLEGYAASIYAGVPTIHMPRAAVSMISDMVQWRDDGLAYTPAGSKIAVGGGYDDVDMLLSGDWDLYATGEVYIERSEQIDISQYVVPGDNALAVGNLSDNTAVALAERMYRVAVDCFVAKATAHVFDTTPTP